MAARKGELQHSRQQKSAPSARFSKDIVDAIAVSAP
jgi:hypothetical protein